MSRIPAVGAAGRAEAGAVRGTPMTRRLACRSVLAALLALVEAVGRAEAGEILTYRYTTDSVIMGEAVSGSFQVDSSHIHNVINTDISDFIINLSFTGGDLTFAPSSFGPLNVTVTPMGHLTLGSGSSIFEGTDSSNTSRLTVNAAAMSDQRYDVISASSGDPVSLGTGRWTRTGLTLPAVPEPSTFVLAGVGGLGLLVLARRRSSKLASRFVSENEPQSVRFGTGVSYASPSRAAHDPVPFLKNTPYALAHF